MEDPRPSLVPTTRTLSKQCVLLMSCMEAVRNGIETCRDLSSNYLEHFSGVRVYLSSVFSIAPFLFEDVACPELVVFGATGNQGGSVANLVLDDAELSAQYAVRAITRSASNPRAQALQEKRAEVIEADLDDPCSLKAALAGAHTLFALTYTQQTSDTVEVETQQANALCKEAVNAGVK